nr:hypothetical protein [Syntrophales bacterium]
MEASLSRFRSLQSNADSLQPVFENSQSREEQIPLSSPFVKGGKREIFFSIEDCHASRGSARNDYFFMSSFRHFCHFFLFFTSFTAAPRLHKGGAVELHQ